jgi:hypothetical protein
MGSEHEDDKRSEDSIEPHGTQALIISTDFLRMPEIVRFIAGLPRTRIVYQRVAAPGTRLTVVEEGRR